MELNRREKVQWRLVQTFDGEESLKRSRILYRVSKRKTDDIRKGRKVTYRCNAWKRTRCPYQMYVLHTLTGIHVYAANKHEHDANCPAYVERLNSIRLKRREDKDNNMVNSLNSLIKESQIALNSQERNSEDSMVFDETPEVTSQDDFLNSLIQQATQMSSTPPEEPFPETGETNGMSMSDTLFLNKLNETALVPNRKEEDGSCSSVSGAPSAGAEFALADGTSIAALLQIAADSDLTFTFNSRRSGEYCFESNKRGDHMPKMVTFSDSGSEIRVAHKIGEEEIHIENWRKSDWPQFCWAVRGACLAFLKF